MYVPLVLCSIDAYMLTGTEPQLAGSEETTVAHLGLPEFPNGSDELAGANPIH